MHRFITFIRNTANRHPRVAWFLADIVRRFPRLNQYLAQSYGVRIPSRPIQGDLRDGYRFALVTSQDALSPAARTVLKQLGR